MIREGAVKQVISVSMALIAATLAAPVAAAEMISLTSGNGVSSGYQVPGEAVTFGSSQGPVTITGWSVDYSDTIRKGQLGVWSSGIGVRNSRTDNSHTIDNKGWTDFILLQFENAVVLNSAQFNTGWQWLWDTDATIGFGVLPLSDVSNLEGESWPISWLTTYESGSVGYSGNSLRDINPNGETGNVWLIGASFNNPDWKADGFKLASITVSAVPEPRAWILLLFGIGAIGAAMRAQRAGRASRVSFAF